MKHFKDALNTLYAYESDGSQDAFIKPDLTPITDAQAEAIRKSVNPVLQINTTLAALSAWQVRKVLTMFGLRSRVEAAIALADDATKDAWQFAKEFERSDPLLNGMASQLGLTQAQLDQFFKVGITL